MVDDIDYFAFPRKFLPENYGIFNEILEKKRFLKSKKMMLERVLWYAKKLRKGELKFPKALELVWEIQNDRIL